MTALRFQTRGRHQTSPASLRGFEFGMGQYINFTEVSMVSWAYIRRNARETTTPNVHDEPPNGCLGDLAPFLLECIRELVDVVWLVRPSRTRLPRTSHKCLIAMGES